MLASGRGSNLQSLVQAFPAGSPLASVVLVVSDQPQALALQRAVEAAVPALHIPFPKGGRAQFEQSLQQVLLKQHIDLVLLAGFMRLLSAQFVAQWPHRILNIHPSLLPQFPGLHAQRQALAAGATVSGCTVHFVDAGMDTGPIVAQAQVPIWPGDTEESLAERILQQEHRLYPQAVRQVLAGLGTITP